jgi:hypothetical protein
LPGTKIRHAEIENLARSNDVVERVESLLHRRLVIEQMKLVEFKVVGAESLQTVESFITIDISLLVREF